MYNFCLRISRFRAVVHCGDKEKRHEIDILCILTPKSWLSFLCGIPLYAEFFFLNDFAEF